MSRMEEVQDAHLRYLKFVCCLRHICLVRHAKHSQQPSSRRLRMNRDIRLSPTL